MVKTENEYYKRVIDSGLSRLSYYLACRAIDPRVKILDTKALEKMNGESKLIISVVVNFLDKSNVVNKYTCNFIGFEFQDEELITK